MEINFKAPPTCSRFMQDDSRVRVLAGPVGSGKSVTGCFEILRRATEQAKNSDGYRYSRFAVIRETTPQLRDTTLKTFMDWFPPHLFPGSVWHKSSYTYYLQMGDVRCEIMFRALDRPGDIAKLNSLELTGAWVNECRDIKSVIIDALAGRVGRYPSTKNGEPGPTWYGWWGDTNMPIVGSWWWCQMEGINPEDGVSPIINHWGVYIQPSGLSPEAENIENLPPTYYYDLANSGKGTEYVNVMVHAQYGTSPAGQPVFKYFSTQHHVAPQPLGYIPDNNLPLIVGMDLGLQPAAVICQQDRRGRVLVLDELVSYDMPVQRFAREMLRPLLTTKYSGMKVALIIDPAGTQRMQTDGRNSLGILQQEGFHVMPASTNAISARVNAVDNQLMRHVDFEAALLLSPTCLRLKAAMMGGYRYHETKPEIIKDHHSHVADAFQYAMLHVSTAQGAFLTGQARPVEQTSALGWAA